MTKTEIQKEIDNLIIKIKKMEDDINDLEKRKMYQEANAVKLTVELLKEHLDGLKEQIIYAK